MNQPNKVLVSVLMAVFNTPFDLVKRAIESVLCQDFQDFELIIIDDGSDEELGMQILHYIQAHHPKITYIWHENRGQSQSINKGVKISNGAYIAIIDSDDEYKPHHLSSCLNEVPQSDLISSFTETIVNKEEDYYVPDRHNHQNSIHVDDCILFATLFGRKEVFQRLSFKNMYAADADFYDQAMVHYRVKKVDMRTYVYYRNSANSITTNLKRKQLEYAD